MDELILILLVVVLVVIIYSPLKEKLEEKSRIEAFYFCKNTENFDSTMSDTEKTSLVDDIKKLKEDINKEVDEISHNIDLINNEMELVNDDINTIEKDTVPSNNNNQENVIIQDTTNEQSNIYSPILKTNINSINKLSGYQPSKQHLSVNGYHNGEVINNYEYNKDNNAKVLKKLLNKLSNKKNELN